MKNMIDYESLKDQHLDMMLRLAYQREEEMEVQEILDTFDEDDVPATEEDFDRVYALFQKKLEVEECAEKKRARRAALRRSLPRIAQVAACLIIVAAIATPIAIANVEMLRVSVMNVLLDIQKDHTGIQLIEEVDAAFYVPADWEGEYYPTYLPNGYELKSVDSVICLLSFADSQNNMLYFHEYQSSDKINIDSEDAVVNQEKIDGIDIMLVEKNGITKVVWQNSDHYFVLETNIEHDEIVNVVKGVKIINK